MTYAKGTQVSVDKSRIEIEVILAKYGASQRAVMYDDEKGLAAIGFVVKGAKYRIDIPLPTVQQIRIASKLDQARRERWRAIVLMLKAKLEIVTIGASSIEKEFMASLVLDNGKTVFEELPEMVRRGLGDGSVRQLGMGES